MGFLEPQQKLTVDTLSEVFRHTPGQLANGFNLGSLKNVAILVVKRGENPNV